MVGGRTSASWLAPFGEVGLSLEGEGEISSRYDQKLLDPGGGEAGEDGGENGGELGGELGDESFGGEEEEVAEEGGGVFGDVGGGGNGVLPLSTSFGNSCSTGVPARWLEVGDDILGGG